MARRLKTIAAAIREQYPELVVECVPWTTSTDRKIGRLRWPGRGRSGYRLTVRRRSDAWPSRPIFQHTSGETYRTNDEVEQWVAAYAECRAGRHGRPYYQSDPRCSTCDTVLKNKKTKETK